MGDFDRAAAKARAREAARKNGNPGTELVELDDDDSGKAAAIVGIDPGAVMTISSERVTAKLASGEWKAQPMIMKLKRGTTYEVFLEGRGPDAEINDPREGKKMVGTWLLHSLDNAGIRASILTSAQLDRKLPPYVGKSVSITRLEEHDTSTGGRVTDYLVAGDAAVVDQQLADAAPAPKVAKQGSAA